MEPSVVIPFQHQFINRFLFKTPFSGSGQAVTEFNSLVTSFHGVRKMKEGYQCLHQVFQEFAEVFWYFC